MGEPSIDHKVRAERFHLRAQRAESALIRSQRLAGEWDAAWQRCQAIINNLNNRDRNRRKKINRLRHWYDLAMYYEEEIERLYRQRDPLRRIIALGERFP